MIYGASINENLGFGVGGYISGGSQALYKDVTLAGFAGSNEVKTDLTIAEIAAGLGYRVNEKLKLGLAYRVVVAKANFAFLQRGTGTVANIQVNDLEDTNYAGFKLGAQYKLSENGAMGFTYRSQTDFAAKGKFGGMVHTSTLNLPIDKTDATARTTLPMQATLGYQHKLDDSWNFLSEYAWTQYSKVEDITVEGTLTRSNGASVIGRDPKVVQKWKDQHNIRLGAEYLAFFIPIRFGYGWTSQVTNTDYARASFTAPGSGHTLTLGTGTNVGESLSFDGGLEYTWVKGEGHGAAAGTGGAGNDIRAGDYSTTAYALHLGATYHF
ncbi:MAG: hypothetical protein HC902_03245 [Calothrix sp. SM1_5_4]|nr:hypothetical protein [Calothrix sp. SM1_5_4]